ncbi:hypothetical protein VR41_04180 [Streptomyces sp. NRRL B-1568]|nr:hypothetical protein VR41_04180 [Streptomyces sp. NRRL B-1568]
MEVMEHVIDPLTFIDTCLRETGAHSFVFTQHLHDLSADTWCSTPWLKTRSKESSGYGRSSTLAWCGPSWGRSRSARRVFVARPRSR